MYLSSSKQSLPTSFSPFLVYVLSLPTSTLSADKVPTESYLSQLTWQDSPIYTEMHPEKRLLQPEPPCPAPGQQPVQIMDLWERYSDPSSGRSYYVNSVTKERSWKPPRRTRGHATIKVEHPTIHIFSTGQRMLRQTAGETAHLYARIVWLSR